MNEKRPDTSRNLPKKLKQLRDLKGWSQGQLSKIMGIHVKQISKYERGVSFPTVDVLIKISKAYGITLDDLILDEKRIDVTDIRNPDLLQRFDQASRLEEEFQTALLTVIDALIMQHQIKNMANKKPPL